MSEESSEETSEEKPKSEPPKKGRRMTPLEYERAKRLYELGAATVKELAEEAGIRPDSLYERFRRDGVEKGSRVSEALMEMDGKISDEASKLAERISATRETHYVYAEGLAKITMQTVVEARRTGKPLATVDGDLAALNKAAKTLEVLRKERYTLLGLDSDGEDPNELDEILITEMTPDQIASLQKIQMGGTGNDEAIDDLLNEIDVVEENEDSQG